MTSVEDKKSHLHRVQGGSLDLDENFMFAEFRRHRNFLEDEGVLGQAFANDEP